MGYIYSNRSGCNRSGFLELFEPFRYLHNQFGAISTSSKTARDMTYKEWQQSFVEGDKTGLQEAKSDDITSSMDITNEWTKTKGIKGTVAGKQE